MNLKLITKNVAMFGIFACILTGCTYKSAAFYVNPEENPESTKLCKAFKKPLGLCSIQEEALLIDGISNKSNYGFTHIGFTNAAAGVLQAAAEATLLKGKTHFAIIYPDAISARNGVLMNTAEEFMDKCKITMGDILTFSGNDCNIFPNRKGYYAQIAIKIYDNQQTEIMTYNANDVISHLKKTNYYDSDGSVNNIIYATPDMLKRLGIK